MPPARAADPEVNFYGVLGNAMTNGAQFKGSLTNDGPLKLGRSHWLGSALAKYLGPVAVPATRLNTSMRLVVYVFMPAFVFEDALDVVPLPFWPSLARVAKLLRALLDVGLPSADVGLPRQAQQLVLVYAEKLSAADRTLRRAEVVEVVRPPNTWLDNATPSLLRSSDPDNTMLAEFMALLVSAYVDMTVDARAVACIELMFDAPDTLANAIKAVETFRERTAENGNLRGLVPYAQIASEIMRRNNKSESVRFAPLFDAYHEVAYPALGKVFPSLSGEGGGLRRALSALALGLKVTGPFVDAVASSMAATVAPLIGNLDLECASALFPEDRATTLLRLHAEMPGGHVARTVSKDGAHSVSNEKVDKLVADPLFADLQTRLLACAPTDSFAVLKLLLSHEHPAGLVFVSTSRSVHLSAWVAYAGVKDSRMWQSVQRAACDRRERHGTADVGGHDIPQRRGQA